MQVIDNIPIKLELEDVVKKTRIRNMNDGFRETINELLDIARPIAKPKAVFEICRVENRQGDSLEIGGKRFTSHVLSVNLENTDTVFPYVVTCGREVDAIKLSENQIMQTYFLDQIKEVMVRSALGYVVDHIRNNYAC